MGQILTCILAAATVRFTSCDTIMSAFRSVWRRTVLPFNPTCDGPVFFTSAFRDHSRRERPLDQDVRMDERTPLSTAVPFTSFSPERTSVGCFLYWIVIPRSSDYKSILEKYRDARSDDVIRRTCIVRLSVQLFSSSTSITMCTPCSLRTKFE